MRLRFPSGNPDALPNPFNGCSPDTKRIRTVLAVFALILLVVVLVVTSGRVLAPFILKGSF